MPEPSQSPAGEKKEKKSFNLPKDIDLGSVKELSPNKILNQADSSDYKQVLLYVGIALVVAALIYGGIVLNQNLSLDEPTSPTPTKTTEVNPKIKQQVATDLKRKEHISLLNSALQSYFLTNKKAPKTLEELVPDHIPAVPLDPETDKPYLYTTSTDQSTWTLSATLSSGKEFKKEGP